MGVAFRLVGIVKSGKLPTAEIDILDSIAGSITELSDFLTCLVFLKVLFISFSISSGITMLLYIAFVSKIPLSSVMFHLLPCISIGFYRILLPLAFVILMYLSSIFV